MTTDSLDAKIHALRGPILVTGASGFVGASLFRKITAVREDVYAVVHHDKGWRLRDAPDKQVVAADLSDQISTARLIEGCSPRTVFHCADYDAAEEFDDPDIDVAAIYQTSFASLVRLVDSLAAHSVTAFVNAGSASEYGANCAAPREDAMCEPDSPRGIAKLAIANYLRYMGKQRGFPAVNLRLYSVYGPMDHASSAVARSLRAASPETETLPDPETLRDYVHIDDVCEAFILAAGRMHPGLYGQNLNIGTGVATSSSELVAPAGKIVDRDSEPRLPAAAAQKPAEYADPGKALEEIGWKARIPLHDGLRSTSQWAAALTDEEWTTAAESESAARRRGLSAIIACYMDGEAIPVMHQRLTDTFRQLGIGYEIIFVNDGSPDDSAEVIRAISAGDPHVLGITHSRNFGSHMAFRSGMELSTMDGVVLFDGDLQDPPEMITDFYAKWQQGYDVVYGTRVKREMPWYLGFWYKLYYRLFSGFSYLRIPLDAGEFSLLDRRVVGWVLSSPERELYLRGLRAYVGFKQTGVDYVRPERMFGRSTRNFRKNFDFAKRTIFSFSNSPMQMVTNTGITALVVSLLYAVFAVVMRFAVPDAAPHGFTTTLLFILVFGSLNLIAVGVVGEYVSMILTEVKGRPRLIRSSLIRNGTHIELPANGHRTPTLTQ